MLRNSNNPHIYSVQKNHLLSDFSYTIKKVVHTGTTFEIWLYIITYFFHWTTFIPFAAPHGAPAIESSLLFINISSNEDVLSEKHEPPIVFTVLGISIFKRLGQFVNALDPIFSIPSGITNCFKLDWA